MIIYPDNFYVVEQIRKYCRFDKHYLQPRKNY